MDHSSTSSSSTPNANTNPNAKVHIIVLPYHGQGHMNPMLQFAKRLSWKGATITLATVLSASQQMKHKLTSSNISLHTIYDDSLDDPKAHFFTRVEKFKSVAGENLSSLLTSFANTTTHVAVIYDANLPWAVEVAKKHGVPSAAFFTQACAYVASYYPLYLEDTGVGPDPYTLDLPEIVPGPDVMRKTADAFSWIKTEEGQLHPIIKMVVKQYATLGLADWVLFNSFHELEDEVIKWMKKLWPVMTIGPTLPSAYLDKRLENDVSYGFNLFKPTDDDIMQWLGTKEAGSVVYVAFGSAASLSEEQMLEIAEALKQVPSSFLLVVRETEKSKLPSNFIPETSEKGLVVSWCPQLDVLAHEAVGCFVTHCGWNSTIEALSLGVPMLAMPQFMDQILDAHFVDQVWGVGIRPKADEMGFVTREEIVNGLGELLRGDRATKIKENAAKWKAVAKEAVDEGGSSDKQIDEILARLVSS